ncbi:MAG TPA: phosphotransferase [Gammaproteobacteria bacterium]
MNPNTPDSRPTDRDREIEDWLAHVIGRDYRMTPASSDASFRRYFRIYHEGSTQILMDAPPQHEDCRPFIHAQSLLSDAAVSVPKIIEANPERGLLLLGDLGTLSYLDELNEKNCDGLYGDALNALARMQTRIPANTVPEYDLVKLDNELRLFPDWFLGKHLNAEISDDLQRTLDECFETLTAVCLEQPRVFVHRDYHSRNLMRLEARNPGVLDFQDAVGGPVTYDLVSLFRDVYIAWPAARVDEWVRGYFKQLACQCDDLAGVDEAEFMRWFDLTGVQRHLKVAGIFCRLYYRDGKPGYLRDIPLTLRYLTEVGAGRAETLPLIDALGALGVSKRLEVANAAILGAGAAGGGP